MFVSTIQLSSRRTAVASCALLRWREATPPSRSPCDPTPLVLPLTISPAAAGSIPILCTGPTGRALKAATTPTPTISMMNCCSSADGFSASALYHTLHARTCAADISAALGAAYFSAYHPAALWLGDPGVRDAVIHAVQACIPLRRLVPIRVDRITIAGDLSGGGRVEASERAQRDATYIYDLNLRDATGRLVEKWEGLHLRDIGPIAYRGGLPAMLLEPWLEREWLRADAAVDLKLVRLPFAANGSGLFAVRELCPTVTRRADGRPEPNSPGVFASATHSGGTDRGHRGERSSRLRPRVRPSPNQCRVGRAPRAFRCRRGATRHAGGCRAAGSVGDTALVGTRGASQMRVGKRNTAHSRRMRFAGCAISVRYASGDDGAVA